MAQDSERPAAAADSPDNDMPSQQPPPVPPPPEPESVADDAPPQVSATDSPPIPSPPAQTAAGDGPPPNSAGQPPVPPPPGSAADDAPPPEAAASHVPVPAPPPESAVPPPPPLVPPIVEPVYPATGPKIRQPVGAGPEQESMARAAEPPPGGKPRRVWLRWTIAGAAVLVVGVGVAIGWNQIQKINERDHGPDSVVSDYMNLRTGNDLDAARKMVKDNVKGSDAALLTNEIYAKVHPTKARVLDTKLSNDGKTAQVSVQYTREKQSFQETYNVTKAGKEGLFFDKWTIAPVALPSVKISTNAAGNVLVAGADITEAAKGGPPATAAGLTITLPAYPGIYQARFEDPKEFLESVETNINVLPISEQRVSSVTLTSAVRSDIKKAVDAAAKDQLRAKMDACVASRLLGTTCPEVVKKDGREIVGRAITGIKVGSYPAPIVTYSIATDTWSYTGAGYIEISGYSQQDPNKIVTLTRICPYVGTLTRDDDGKVSLS